MRLHRMHLPIATILFAACNPLQVPVDQPVEKAVEGEERQTLYVAPYTRTCQGMYEMQCMLVRESRDGEWLNFYDHIQGFTYEPGYAYVLLVGWREVPNPPADGSSREYWLIQTIEKKRAAGS
jgi:hypothetical protein